MENHEKVLGILYVVLATFQTVTMVLLALLFTTIFSFAMGESEPADARVLELVMSLARYVPSIVILLFALPSLVVGIGLLTKQSWAMIFALIMGCLNLFSFPFGTAIGIYTIWVYSEEQRLEKINRVPS